MSGEGTRSLEQILNEVEEQKTADGGEDVSESTFEDAGETAGNAALSALLSSPQLLKTVGSLSSLLAASQSTKSEEKAVEKNKPDARALLSALRPYLGEHRRTTIDGMLQLLQLYSVLQALPWQQLLHRESK